MRASRARIPSGWRFAASALLLLAGCARVVVDTGATGSAGTGAGGAVAGTGAGPGTGAGFGAGGAGAAGAGGTGGGTSACQDQAFPEIPGLASAIATPQSGGDGSLRVNLSSSDATCADPLHFPGDCAPAWRLRLEIPPAQQVPGTYPLSLDSAIFAYLDGQAPGSGAQCQNLGTDYAATLVISVIDATQVAGLLCGNPKVQGTFTAPMCTSCKGTGEPCSTDADCCFQLCTGAMCQP
jgi:hypothetical protein